jgi:hypothetical protein
MSRRAGAPFCRRTVEADEFEPANRYRFSWRLHVVIDRSSKPICAFRTACASESERICRRGAAPGLGSLNVVRTFAVVAILAVAGLASATDRQGTYKPATGSAVSWNVNSNHTLMWAGTPYIPRGLRISATVADVQRAKSLGFKDVLVEVPLSNTPPNDVYAELDKSQMRYMVAIDSLAPTAKGYAVEPQGYRVAGISGSQRVEFSIPGSTSALAVLVVKRDASVDWAKRVPIQDGKFAIDITPANDVDRVLLVYPEEISIAQPDYGADFDRHRDTLLAMLKKSAFGSGFRGLVNPLGRALHLESLNDTFVPGGEFFRVDFENFLRDQYKSVETAEKAWSMSSSDVDSFTGLSRLVPLWSGLRGVSQLWDPTTDKLYDCDSVHSRAWPDITAAVAAVAAKRYVMLANAIRAVVDVPIVQEWTDWTSPYGDDGAGLAGLGMIVTAGTADTTVQSAARPASAVLNWRTPAWFLATDLMFDPNAQPDSVLEDLASIGARGWYARAQDLPLLKALAGEAVKDNAQLADYSPQPLYFPENATNPAVAQRLPAGKWWLPSPSDGNRLDLGTKFSGYRFQSKTGQFIAIWLNTGTARVAFRMVNPKAAKFATIDGSDPMPKIVKGGVTVTMTEYPLLITGTEEIPIPEAAVAETALRLDALFDQAEKLRRDVTQDRYEYKNDLDGFDSNPGGSFAMLRELYWRVNQKVGRLMWMEGERITDTNFSGPVAIPGCSGGSALTLRTPVATTAEGYYASYSMPVTKDDDVEIWMAAKIPKEERSEVRLIVGGEVFRLDEDPVSAYGAGFAWYHLGTTRVGGSNTNVRIEVKPKAGADLAIDAVLFYPGKFVPSGTRMPDGMVFPNGVEKKKKHR